jgi:hypothetical protein
LVARVISSDACCLLPTLRSNRCTGTEILVKFGSADIILHPVLIRLGNLAKLDPVPTNPLTNRERVEYDSTLDASIISALSALSGAAVGGERRRDLAKSPKPGPSPMALSRKNRRQMLYRDFAEEASAWRSRRSPSRLSPTTWQMSDSVGGRDRPRGSKRENKR